MLTLYFSGFLFPEVLFLTVQQQLSSRGGVKGASGSGVWPGAHLICCTLEAEKQDGALSLVLNLCFFFRQHQKMRKTVTMGSSETVGCFRRHSNASRLEWSANGRLLWPLKCSSTGLSWVKALESYGFQPGLKQGGQITSCICIDFCRALEEKHWSRGCDIKLYSNMFGIGIFGIYICIG